MTIEEKAKNYDRAIERARKLKEDPQSVFYEYSPKEGDTICDYIFPELRESEGEKIRKDIIVLVKDWWDRVNKDNISTKEQMIAWLEKQGKGTSWKPSKEEMDVLYGLAYITNQYDEHKESVITRLYQDLKREFFNGSSYENMFPTNISAEDDVRRRSTIQVLEYARSLDTYNQYGKADIDKNIAWLEKQKDTNALIQEASEKAYAEGMRVERKHWLERRGKQPHIDKTEPKFKVGDTITSSRSNVLKYLIKEVGIENELGELDYVVEDVSDSEFRGSIRRLSIKKVDEWAVLCEVQKPAWSDEDEKMLSGIIDEIEANKSGAPSYDIPTYDKWLNWLESLKERLSKL